MPERPTSSGGRSSTSCAEYHEAAFGRRRVRPRRDAGAGLGPSVRRGGAAAVWSMRRSTSGSPRAASPTSSSARFARVFGVRHAMLVNSGSSANLLALSALTSPTLGERRLQPGDEVITVAAGFPTTVNPILQNGLVPVFLDVTRADLQRRRRPSSRQRSARAPAPSCSPTRWAIPFDLGAVARLRRGARPVADRGLLRRGGRDLSTGGTVGTFGDLATVSFYPAHHITMGEGGCVLTEHAGAQADRRVVPRLGPRLLVRPGQGQHLRQALRLAARRAAARLRPQVHLLAHRLQPQGHRHAGRGRRRAARQAARRSSRRGGATSRGCTRGCADLEEFFDAARGDAVLGAELVRLPHDCCGPARRSSATALIDHLESRRIATRLLFAGNLTRQPAYCRRRPTASSAISPTTDRVMRDAFWIGVYPGLTEPMLDYVIDSLRSWCRR